VDDSDKFITPLNGLFDVQPKHIHSYSTLPSVSTKEAAAEGGGDQKIEIVEVRSISRVTVLRVDSR
jgi:hypothetical protein